MHDSVGLQKGTSLQSAKLQVANLLQNCYFCLIQKTISNAILWPLVIKYFWPGCFAPPYLLRPGATAPPPLLRHCLAAGRRTASGSRITAINTIVIAKLMQCIRRRVLTYTKRIDVIRY